MTLAELLATLPKQATWRDRALGVLYFQERTGASNGMTAADIKSALIGARVPRARNANMSDVLAKAGGLVDGVGGAPGGGKVWRLTASGRAAMQTLTGLPDDQPEVQHGVEQLRAVAAQIQDDDTRAYIEEAILCLSVGALRSAIVYVWVAAADTLRSRVWRQGAAQVTTALQRHVPKAKALGKSDDLAEVKEVMLLQLAQDLGVLDKSQKQMLDHCLTTRNQCGHPSKYNPGVAKAKSHIEDIVGILYT